MMPANYLPVCASDNGVNDQRALTDGDRKYGERIHGLEVEDFVQGGKLVLEKAVLQKISIFFLLIFTSQLDLKEGANPTAFL